MPLPTPLTRLFGIEYPIISAPMGAVAGGELAAAVSRAGGLGLIGGGYGDATWLARQFDLAGSVTVGCGFITWSLARQPRLLDLALERDPVAVMLSFGDPEPFAAKITSAGVPLICQVQNLAWAERALHVGADVLVAQGREAGGHGHGVRSTMTLVPEVVDLVAAHGRATPVLAAGGIADGRGLAAALMLGRPVCWPGPASTRPPKRCRPRKHKSTWWPPPATRPAGPPSTTSSGDTRGRRDTR
jgi:nitronate monooxygenase